MNELLRKVNLDGFILTLSATNRTDRRGQTRIAYELVSPNGQTFFDGDDFCGSPMHADDSDETIRALLSFLTLRPGDTDAEYFDDYTDVQRAFAENDAESLSLWTIEGDDDQPSIPFIDAG